jgi:hypothetical protein
MSWVEDWAEIAAEARERFGIHPEPAAPATPRLEIITLVVLVVPQEAGP